MLSDCYLTLEICYYLCKKINMKGRHIKILTIFGLIAIIALQTIWLCNAYIQFSKSIYKDSNDILKKSLNREASIRFEKTPKGTMINGAPIKDSNEIVPEIAYLNEGLLKLGLELSLTNVDSLANDFLKATNIESTITIYLLNTDTKVLIIGGDSNLAVQTFKGYSHFLNLIYNSKFTETSYGVPITCSFSYANSHGLVETEFINTIHIEPLYVKPSRENNSYLPDYSNKSDYHSSSQLYLYFYKDREKTKPSQPYIDIIFNISMFENKCNYEPNYKNWPMINANCTDKTERIIMRNIDFKSKIYVGYNSSYYESTGSMPMEPNEPMRMWNATEYTREYSLLNSPFYQIIY